MLAACTGGHGTDGEAAPGQLKFRCPGQRQVLHGCLAERRATDYRKRTSHSDWPAILRAVTSGDRLSELERAVAVYEKLRAKLGFGPAAAQAVDTQLRLFHSGIHAERGKRDLAAGEVMNAAAHFREAAGAGAGWKVQIVNLALRIAPRVTRHAYAFRTRRGATPEVA